MFFLARAKGRPQGRDDAVEAKAFDPAELPINLAFDHGCILADYLEYKTMEDGPKNKGEEHEE